MRIGILIDRLNVGGVEKIAIEEVIALRKENVDAILVVLREEGVVKDAFPDLLKGVPITYLDRRLPRLLRESFKIPGFSFFSWFHLSYPILLPFVVKRKEFDYLIVHGTYTSLSAIAFKKRRGIPFSTFIWDPASYILDRVYTGRFSSSVLKKLKIVAKQLDRYIIKHTSVILAGGHAHDDFFQTIDPHKKIEIIYPSVQPAAKQVKKQDFVMMMTAWKEGKKPEYIFTLLDKIPDLNVKMIGKWVDPLYREAFQRQVSSKNLNGRLEVVGGVSERELTDYYASALVLLQTNDDRGFGMPAIEAAGKGTTFIIPRDQGVCDLFTNGVHGFYTKEHDTKTIVTLLKKLLADHSLASTMGNNALKQVRENYSWKNHAEKIMEVVDESKSQP